MHMRVLAASDKFKGTASAAQVCAAIGHACWNLNIDCVEMPMADGGEGTLEVLGGANRVTTVAGPLGHPVQAEWRLHRGVAVIEMALHQLLARGNLSILHSTKAQRKSLCVSADQQQPMVGTEHYVQ
jgi:glycerate kinase